MREATAIVGAPATEPGPIYGFRVVETAYGATIKLMPGGILAAVALMDVRAPAEHPWSSIKLHAGNYSGRLIVHLADTKTDTTTAPAPFVPLQPFGANAQAVRVCLVGDTGDLAGSVDGVIRVTAGQGPGKVLAFGNVTPQTSVQAVVDVSRYASVAMEVTMPRLSGDKDALIKFFLERVALDGGYVLERLQAGHAASADGVEAASVVVGPGLAIGIGGDGRVDHDAYNSSYCRRLHRARVAWDVTGSPSSASGMWWLLGWGIG